MKRTAIIVLVLVALAALAGGLYWYWRSRKSASLTAPAIQIGAVDWDGGSKLDHVNRTA